MWREKMEPFIISKSVFNVAGIGLFWASFYQSFIIWDSPLRGVNDSPIMYSSHLKSCHPQHCGFQKGEKKE